MINYIAISAVADSFYFKFGNYLIGFGAAGFFGLFFLDVGS
ncbi:hypothetical protein [Vagococcus fessus]|nr:hypothetical protein [Vagococcus fessus]